MTSTEDPKTYVPQSEWKAHVWQNAELDYIAKRREAVGIYETPFTGANDPDSWHNAPIGLTFSGGGIRSATFNLGILQGLSDQRILPYIDYLSTVSGGGYIGACMTSLLSPENSNPDSIRRQFSTRREEFPLDKNLITFKHRKQPIAQTPDDHADFSSGMNAQVAHLRRRGNFIIPDFTLLSIDTLRAIGAVITSMFFTIALFMLFFLTVAAAHYFFFALFAPGLMDQEALRNALTAQQIQVPVIGRLGSFRAVLSLMRLADFGLSNPLWLAFASGGGAGFISSLLIYSIKPASRNYKLIEKFGERLNGFRSSHETSSNEKNYVTGIVWACIGLVFVVLVVVAFGGKVVAASANGSTAISTDDVYWLFWPLVFSLGVRIATVGLYPFFMRGKKWSYGMRSALSTFQGSATYALIFAFIATILVIPQYVPISPEAGPSALPAATTVALSTIWAALLSLTGGSGSQNVFVRQINRLPQRVRNFLLGLFVWGVMLGGIYFYQVLFERMYQTWFDGWRGFIFATTPPVWYNLLLVVGIFGAAGLGVLIIGVFVNFNKVSLHYFYRDRIADTYLRTVAIGENGQPVEVRNDREKAMKDVNPDGSTAPYHIVLCALNLLGSSNLDRKDRKSDQFTFTRDYCGSDTTGYVRTEKYLVVEDEKAQRKRPKGSSKSGEQHHNVGVKLSRAVAISGAAVGSGIGQYSFFAVAFITTLLNIRLGYWILNPNYYARAGKQVTTLWSRLSAKLFPHPLGERATFWPKYLLLEMFANSNAGALVNISDGAHTGDNIGIIPLLKRRCRVIFAVDAGTDNNYHFEDLANAIRQSYIDEGIEIVELNLDAIEPDPDTGFSKQHAAIGQIKYPNKNGKAPDIGWLVVIKPTLTGDEGVDLKTYKKNNSTFPQQTTGDQFFDDNQFEAYRKLGEQSINHVLKYLDGYSASWQYHIHAMEAWKHLVDKNQDSLKRDRLLQAEFLKRWSDFHTSIDQLSVTDLEQDPTYATQIRAWKTLRDATQALGENCSACLETYVTKKWPKADRSTAFQTAWNEIMDEDVEMPIATEEEAYDAILAAPITFAPSRATSPLQPAIEDDYAMPNVAQNTQQAVPEDLPSGVGVDLSAYENAVDILSIQKAFPGNENTPLPQIQPRSAAPLPASVREIVPMPPRSAFFSAAVMKAWAIKMNPKQG